jgi:pimeloyl-[acyl-carrier protein] synthase
MIRKWMLFEDPPDHTRIRHAVAKAFTPDAIGKMAGRIEAITHELLDNLRDASTFDLIADFAFPLPVNVIAEMLGVPAAHRGQFRSRFRDIIYALDLTRTDTNIRHAAEVARALEDYFRDLAADHRARPRNNLMSALIEAKGDGGEISEGEFVGNCILLVSAACTRRSTPGWPGPGRCPASTRSHGFPITGRVASTLRSCMGPLTT